MWPVTRGTKWRRLLENLSRRQAEDGCSNSVLRFISTALNPVRFTGRQESFEANRTAVNEALIFAGYEVREDGQIRKVDSVRTLADAELRAHSLKKKLGLRIVHPDVLRYCRAELLQDNYFHAAFEATKSVAEKIRDRTGLKGDGAELVDQAFRIEKPLLAVNRLESDTEKSEQKGFANLLKGMFGTFRNVTGHAPKITWTISEDDALDLLSLVSYLHRRLDSAYRTPW